MLVMQDVFYIISLSMMTSLHREPESVGMSNDSCSVQDSDKSTFSVGTKVLEGCTASIFMVMMLEAEYFLYILVLSYHTV
jgi:hypothetical protein